MNNVVNRYFSKVIFLLVQNFMELPPNPSEEISVLFNFGAYTLVKLLVSQTWEILYPIYIVTVVVKVKYTTVLANDGSVPPE